VREAVEPEHKRAYRLREEVAGHRTEAEAWAADIDSAIAALPDPADLDEQIAGAEDVNAKVRANAAKEKALAAVETLREKSREKTARLNAIDEERAKILAAATFPVPGLSIENGAVTFGGIPLDQASQAEAIRVSFGVAAALNPRIRIVMVRDGSLLDADSMAALAAAAAEHDVQVWVERVGDTDEGAIVIEDGTVRGAEVAA